MMQYRTSRAFDFVFIIGIVAFLWWAVVHRVAIGDWIYFLSYQPTLKATQIAQDAGLSAHGQKLFYRTDPQFTSKEAVVAECDIERLGCINPKGQVFILEEPGKHNQAVVTAAHEMLHLAYRRLSQAEKDKLAPLLDEGIAQNSLNGIKDQLKNETTTEDRRDEAHSYLGTEYADLPDELEQYYSKYFSDRAKVVAAQADQR